MHMAHVRAPGVLQHAPILAAIPLCVHPAPAIDTAAEGDACAHARASRCPCAWASLHDSNQGHHRIGPKPVAVALTAINVITHTGAAARRTFGMRKDDLDVLQDLQIQRTEP